MYQCPECIRQFDKMLGLTTHLARSHGISSEVYYGSYLKRSDEGRCLKCGKNTKFKNITLGYQSYCSKSCKSSDNKQRLIDSGKFEEFKAKVSQASKAAHKRAKDDGSSQSRVDRRLKTLEENNFYAKHSKYMAIRWQNLSEDERQKHLNLTIQKPISESEAQRRRKKALETRIQNGKAIDRSDQTVFENYRSNVRRLTDKSYQKYQADLDPLGLRGLKTHHIDHKFSILHGFQNKVPVEIMASKHNLVLLTAKENRNKSSGSSITLEELMRNASL